MVPEGRDPEAPLAKSQVRGGIWLDYCVFAGGGKSFVFMGTNQENLVIQGFCQVVSDRSAFGDRRRRRGHEPHP
jgi:hypothetical protein